MTSVASSGQGPNNGASLFQGGAGGFGDLRKILVHGLGFASRNPFARVRFLHENHAKGRFIRVYGP
jgi:hypothetical protein